MSERRIDSVQEVAAGLAMLVFPIMFMVGFAMHPQFFTAVRVDSVLADYGYITAGPFWTVGHTIVTLTFPVALFAWMNLARQLKEKGPWFAGIGATLSFIGFVMAAASFGATLTMPGIVETLPKEQALAALTPIFERAAPANIWFLLMLGILVGPLVLSIGLFVKRIIPRWSSALLILAYLVFAVFVEIDLIMFVASLAILVALAPAAFRLMAGSADQRAAAAVVRH